MKENLNSKNVTYKNVEFEIFKGVNGNIYVDGLAISKKLKPCLSEWMKENKLLIYNMRTSLGLKMRDFILFSRWLYSDIALCYAKAIGEDFYNFLNTELQEFKEKVNKENQNIMASSIYGNPMYVPGRFEINNTSKNAPIITDDGTSEIQTYNHPLFGSVRMYIENGKPWFCGIDIATSLMYANPSKAIIDHCKSASITIREVGVQTGLKADGTPAIQMKQIKFITEGNIYRLTSKSQMPKADEFESWIFDDVVPSVVNTGGYSLQPQIPNFNNPAEAARAWADQYEKNQTLALEVQQKQILIEQKEEEITMKEEKIKTLLPKGESFDKIMSSEGLVTTNMIAAFLGISAIRLNKLLCDWGVQYRQSSVYFLTAKYRDKGYTKHIPYPYLDNGVQKSREHMYWTEKGRKFVIDLYNSKIAA